MTQRHMEQLSREQCLEYLNASNVGRIVFVDSDGPCALPINYGMFADNIVFRVELKSKLREILGAAVAFEVDHMEPDASLGWSVLLRGEAQEVANDDLPILLKAMKGKIPSPWAEGIHNVWISITSSQMTGRKLGGTHTAAL